MNVAIRKLGQIPASRFHWAWAAGVLSFAAAASAEPLSRPSDLPAEAIAALEQYEAESDALMRRAEAALREKRERLIEHLQAIQDRHTRAADLDAAVAVRDRIRALRAVDGGRLSAKSMIPAPVNMSSYHDRVGESFEFVVCGSANGSVWGSDVYTYDSEIATAAVHCGALRVGESALLRITMCPPLRKYVGSVRFGVSSYDWDNSSGTYAGYEIRRSDVGGDDAFRAALADPGNLSEYAGRIGEVFRFCVVGNVDGSVWGSDCYTHDSDLSTTVVHAGLLEPGQEGVVRVSMHPGPPHFNGSTAHGVTSSDWRNSEGHYSAYRLTLDMGRARTRVTEFSKPSTRAYDRGRN